MKWIVIVWLMVVLMMFIVNISPLDELSKGVIAAGLTFGFIVFLMKQIRGLV